MGRVVRHWMGPGPGKEVGSRPISRVLSRAAIPLRATSPQPFSSLPGSTRDSRCLRPCDRGLLPYLALLQVGFAVPPSVTTGAVRSYRTLSPLPATTKKWLLRRFAFCCTFRGLTSPRRYLAPCPPEPGLSSPPLSNQRDAAAARPTPRGTLAAK